MITSNRRLWRGVLPAALALTVTVPAHAQDQDAAAARALFNEGRRLKQAGHYEEACSKFEAARKLYTSSGLLLNLADCHERLHKTASAWTEFGDAAFAAASAGRKADEAEAHRRQALLEKHLCRLAIHVAEATDGEVVQRDGSPLDRAAWDTPIPVDPGSHDIVAEAPGRQHWSNSVTVEKPGETVTVEVPKLEPTPSAPPATVAASSAAPPDGATHSIFDTPPPPHDPASTGSTQRVLGLVIGGVGVLGMGGSGVMGLIARSQFDNAKGEPQPRAGSDSAAAVRLADDATIVLGAGAAVTVIGAVLWLTAPRAPVAVGLQGQRIVVAGVLP